MTAIRVTSAQPGDLGRYIDLLEEVAGWLAQRGINQWRPGSFRLSRDYYPESINRGEVLLAFSGNALVGTLRLLLKDPIVWPEITQDDGVYVYTLAVRRDCANEHLGGEIDAKFPAPIGTLRLCRFERQVSVSPGA